NTKGGVEKAHLKRAALLKQAANHPKQMKLDFSSILSVEDSITYSNINTNSIIDDEKGIMSSSIDKTDSDLISVCTSITDNPIENKCYTTEFNIKFLSNPNNLTLVQKLEFVNTIHPCQPKLLENVAWFLHRIYNRTDLKVAIESSKKRKENISNNSKGRGSLVTMLSKNTSFDWAANMRGEFNGLHAYIRKGNENSTYIWCYAHVLNLCICDTCDNRDAIKLFELLNCQPTFFSDFYKRMNVWKEQQELLGTGQNKLRKLKKKMVKPGGVVLSALNFVTTSTHVFLKIFVTVGSTSTYLQAKNLDLLAEWVMVKTTIKEIDKINFDDVIKLKLIKNRLRSSLGNEHLEAFLLMTVEKEILDKIEFEDILEI
ncbi:zinc finger MYM-type protein 1-like, partial [Aphis craccivora]